MNAKEEKAARNLLAYMNESRRLSTLSDRELVEEAIETLPDDPIVQELLNRVLPNWLEDEEEWPDVIGA